jgi:hypothetical protein
MRSVILIDLAWQKWLHERASLTRYTYVACPIMYVLLILFSFVFKTVGLNFSILIILYIFCTFLLNFVNLLH